jgi:signal transduction histidine kinase
VLVPALAAGSVVLAVVTDPASWWQSLLLAAAAVALVTWHLLDSQTWLLVPAVLLLTALSQVGGALEPGLFLLSLVALLLTGRRGLDPGAVFAVVAAAAIPMLLMAFGADIAGPIWVMGVAFPAFMGWAAYRQEALTHDLQEARLALAQQAVVEQRQQIARDVHDLVGHGLAAMMVQVTSARHVLRRDPEAAEEALRGAEAVGRTGMADLRRTVALLRGDDAATLPVPGACDIGRLVEAARSGGLDVRYRTSSPLDDVDPVVGLTLYRITQESLANASRHAPRARTTVTTANEQGSVVLDVTTVGPVRPRQAPSRAGEHFGLQGMRERVDLVGGRLTAGPTPEGWQVHVRIPLTPAEDRLPPSRPESRS